jgi:hypothetical protein
MDQGITRLLWTQDVHKMPTLDLFCENKILKFFVLFIGTHFNIILPLIYSSIFHVVWFIRLFPQDPLICFFITMIIYALVTS